MKKIGLVPKLIIAIILGIIIGTYMPLGAVRALLTLSDNFAAFLKFIIPLMIIGFVVTGIADLGNGAGKLLAVTTGISYSSTIIAGTLSYLMATTIFPSFISVNSISNQVDMEAGMLSGFFTIPVEPIIDVTQAIVLAFVIGLCISVLRRQNSGNTLYHLFDEFAKVINIVLSKVIIPLLPVYICGTFANLTVSGQTFNVLSIFWKVFLLIIALHLLYLIVFFTIAGLFSGKNPFKMLKNQVAGYLTAVGTQSSAATIPVNLTCAEKNGVSKEIREFVVPLCATIHLCGSIITITGCVIAVLMMNNMNYSFVLFFPFLLILGVAMVAAPGAPGGAIMSALPFLYMVGIPANSALASLMFALYITQDSFGTAANVSGDNAIAVIVDTIYQRFIQPK